jgi:hypothetical protein
MWSPPAGMPAEGIVPGVPSDHPGLLNAHGGQCPWRESGHHDSPTSSSLLYPTSITGTAGLTLDFIIIHSVSRRGTGPNTTCGFTLHVRSSPPRVTTPHLRFRTHQDGRRRAARRLGFGWKLSCKASGPQLHGLLGSTGLRPMPLHCSRDLGHGPGAGSVFLHRLPPPT